MYGVHGLYDIAQDLLIDWYGREWRWTQPRLTSNAAGECVAELDVTLGSMPWTINLRMQYYRTHLGFTYHQPWAWRPNLKPIAGWCSWEACRRNVAFSDIERFADFFGKRLKDYGLEYIQLDDGFERLPIPADPDRASPAGWLEPNERFPTGHAGVVSAVCAHGLTPAIWTNANVTNPEFAAKNAASFLKDRDGKLMLGEWIDYLLDCSEETLAQHVYPYYKGLHDLGYSLLQDRRHPPSHHGRAARSGQARTASQRRGECPLPALHGRGAQRLARPAESTSWLRGVCWPKRSGWWTPAVSPWTPTPTWAGIRMQLVESARWFRTQRILFLNDPDHICADTNTEWLKSVTRWSRCCWAACSC